GVLPKCRSGRRLSGLSTAPRPSLASCSGLIEPGAGWACAVAGVRLTVSAAAVAAAPIAPRTRRVRVGLAMSTPLSGDVILSAATEVTIEACRHTVTVSAPAAPVCSAEALQERGLGERDALDLPRVHALVGGVDRRGRVLHAEQCDAGLGVCPA